MARYRKIEVATWVDERFRALSPAQPNGQTLWIYLLSGTRTTVFPGLVIASAAVLAADLGWAVKALHKVFAELIREELAAADWDAGLVVLRKALLDSHGDPRDTSRPESPNVVRNWAKSWEVVPDCQLKTEYLHCLGTFCEGLGEGFSKAFREGFAKALAKAWRHPSSNQDSGFRIQDSGDTPKPPQGSEPSLPEPAAAKPRKPRPGAVTPEERQIALRVLGKLSEHNGVTYRSDGHIELVVHRLREGFTELDLRAIVGYCALELEWKGHAKMHAYLRPKTLFGPEKAHEYRDPAVSWAEKNGLLPRRPESDRRETEPAWMAAP